MHGKISATNHRFPNGNGWQFLLLIASLEMLDLVRKFLIDSLLCLKTTHSCFLVTCNPFNQNLLSITAIQLDVSILGS